MSRLVPAKRPREPCAIGTQIDCLCNYFSFKVMGEAEITKFAVTFDPEVPESEDVLRAKLIRKAASGLKEHIGRYVYANTAIYAVRKKHETHPLSVSVLFDNVAYSVSLTHVGAVRQDSIELRHFYNKFFNSIQGNLDLVMIGRKFFDFTSPIELDKRYGITLYPGFSTSVIPLEGGFMVNIDVAHRCLHTSTVYDEMKELAGRKGNFQVEVDKMLVDKVVVTPYNRKIYRIISVDLTMTPMSSFKKKETEMTYFDYYSTQYGITIHDKNQPLLKCKNKRWECYLIPEVCMLTGLTEEQKSDINLRREMIKLTQKSPRDRLMKCSQLVTSMNSTEKTSKIMKEWGVEVSATPTPLKARVLPSGSIALKGYQFSLTESANLDREVQREVYAQTPLSKWAVLYQEEEQHTVNNFMSVLQQVFSTFHVQSSPPNMLPLRGANRWEPWRECISKADPSVTILICIIPGFKGKSPIYDDLKRFVFSQVPVPTQCVLASTLKRDKGLRSVVNKLVTQIIAKTGGCPWAFTQLPFMDGRSMVIGIDAFEKKGVERVTGFCATIDRELCRYVSFPQIGSGTSGSNPYDEVVNDSFASFAHHNSGVLPDKVIVFRDGISDGQKQLLLDQDVAQLLAALKTFAAGKSLPPARLMVIVVNKKISARFYHNLSNPAPGTIVDTAVVGKDLNEFYLVPTKGTQGVITPTHFHTIYDDTGVSPDEVKLLAYRMCYLYYNWTGAIRVPAPCQYAHKIAFAYGEKAQGAEPPRAHNYWKRTRSLYYL